MIRSRSIHACVLVLALVLVAGCGEEKVTQPKPAGLRLSPLPDEEAECMALWLSGEIEAPMDLYERIRSDLKKIRESSFNVAHFESLTFIAPWVPSMIAMSVDSVSRARLDNHESPVWDSLNALYHPEIAESEDGHTYWPHFPGRLNPERLAEAYAQVPGVRWAEPNHVGSFSGWRRYVYPGSLGGDTLTYSFQRGGGFPDEMTVTNTFWCFYSTRQAISYAGVYQQADDGSCKDAPAWWRDFCPVVEKLNPHWLLPDNWCSSPDTSGVL